MHPLMDGKSFFREARDLIKFLSLLVKKEGLTANIFKRTLLPHHSWGFYCFGFFFFPSPKNENWHFSKEVCQR